MSNRRIELIRHWLAGRRNGVGFVELMKTVLDPTLGVKARRYIEKIEEQPPYWRIFLRGISRPLYFPTRAGMYALEMVIVELFHASDWHYYQIRPTRLHADDVVLDCGAAEGLFSLQAETICKEVYAAEPMPMWIEAMSKTFAGSEKVSILPYALSSASGSVQLAEGVLDSTVVEGSQGISVEARTVDSLFVDERRRLTYLKGDLEGSEMNVLRGAERTIRAYRPRVAFTTYHRPEDAEQISTFLRGIHPAYQIRLKGIEQRAGAPVMLHAWID